MKMLLLAESLSSVSGDSGMGNSHIIASLKQGNHQLKVLCASKDGCIIPHWPGIEIEQLFIPEKKIKKNSFISFITNHLHKKNTNDPEKEKSELWIKGISQAISQTKVSYDMAFILPEGHSFIPGFAFSQLNTGIPWIAGFSHMHPFNFNIKQSINEENWMRFRFRIVAEQATWLASPSIRLCEQILTIAPTLHSKLLYLPYPSTKIPVDHVTREEQSIRYPSSWFTLLCPGKLTYIPFVHRFLKAFGRFIGQLPPEASPVKLLLCGDVSHETEMEIQNYGLHPYIRAVKLGTTRYYELLKEVSALLHTEENQNDSLFLPGYIPSCISAKQPLLACVQYRSETRRLLGEELPLYCNANDEDDIYYALIRLWLHWHNNEPRPDYPEKLLYLISEQNINSIMDMTLRLNIRETEPIKD